MAWNRWAGSAPPPFSIKIKTVAQDQVVNALAKDAEELLGRYVHGAQDGTVVACGANPITHGNIYRELPHPIGLWKYEYVWVLTEAPSENACAGARRAHHENRLVGWHGSGQVLLLVVVEHRVKTRTICLAKRIFFGREAAP